MDVMFFFGSPKTMSQKKTHIILIYFNNHNIYYFIFSPLKDTILNHMFLTNLFLVKHHLQKFGSLPRCGGQVSITIQPASTPGGMQGVRVPGTSS